MYTHYFISMCDFVLVNLSELLLMDIHVLFPRQYMDTSLVEHQDVLLYFCTSTCVTIQCSNCPYLHIFTTDYMYSTAQLDLWNPRKVA